MDRSHAEHLTRVRAAVTRAHSLTTMADWICENTYLRGEPFTFLGHEFQETIARDPSRQKNIRKCAQVGLSELSGRTALALANVLESSTTIYTLPTADFAKTFVKTRIDPIISTSPALKMALNNTADNTQIKQFGTSFVYFKGTIGQSAAISVPADALIHDEVDFSDQTVMSSYESRTIHSPYKIKYKFSTPTVDGFGISSEFETSRRFVNFCKCAHCAHWFLPSYFSDVRIPGWKGEDKKEITKEKLQHLRWQEAYTACPACDKEVDLSPEHRAWVCENPTENHEASGYQVQPFDAPGVITASYLVEASTKYDRWVDFVNFGLGLPAQDKETALTKDDIDRCYVETLVPGFFAHVMGIDMGLTCHIVVAGIDATEKRMAVHTERVPLPQLEKRKKELQAHWRVGLTVMDSQPYADTLMRLQRLDQNLYGAVYVTSKDLAVYGVKKTEEKEDALDGEKKAGAGEERERQVNINRNKAFDALMDSVRIGNWLFRADENRELMTKHLTDMKRIKDFTREKEISYVWQKSTKGEDHFHHALLYAEIAARMRGISASSLILPVFLGKFPVKRQL